MPVVESAVVAFLPVEASAAVVVVEEGPAVAFLPVIAFAVAALAVVMRPCTERSV